MYHQGQLTDSAATRAKPNRISQACQAARPAGLFILRPDPSLPKAPRKGCKARTCSECRRGSHRTLRMEHCSRGHQLKRQQAASVGWSGATPLLGAPSRPSELDRLKQLSGFESSCCGPGDVAAHSCSLGASILSAAYRFRVCLFLFTPHLSPHLCVTGALSAPATCDTDFERRYRLIRLSALWQGRSRGSARTFPTANRRAALSGKQTGLKKLLCAVSKHHRRREEVCTWSCDVQSRLPDLKRAASLRLVLRLLCLRTERNAAFSKEQEGRADEDVTMRKAGKIFVTQVFLKNRVRVTLLNILQTFSKLFAATSSGCLGQWQTLGLQGQHSDCLLRPLVQLRQALPWEKEKPAT